MTTELRRQNTSEIKARSDDDEMLKPSLRNYFQAR